MSIHFTPVCDDAKDQESDARNTENNDVKSLTNESNNNDHLVTGQLESSGETDHAQACILDTGQTETVNKSVNKSSKSYDAELVAHK